VTSDGRRSAQFEETILLDMLPSPCESSDPSQYHRDRRRIPYTTTSKRVFIIDQEEEEEDWGESESKWQWSFDTGGLDHNIGSRCRSGTAGRV
jgi:hypothetical protein